MLVFFSKRHAFQLSCLTLIALVSIMSPTILQAEDSFQWTELQPLPDAEGFAGPFAGVSNGALIVAGGANFPGKMPWEGGTKIWYDRVFVLDTPHSTWQEVGKLPRPLGYGISISTDNGIICVGGSDANQHYKDCFRLQWQDGKLITSPLPSLPVACANSCGALLDRTVYVAGGLESPMATTTLKTFWSLDLSDPKAQWQALEPWPGPARMLATAGVQGRSFFLFSGTDLKSDTDGKAVREYLRDAYCYEPGRGWKKIADMPRPAVASPTPAPVFGQSTLLVISGDDGTLVDFKPLDKHPGFPKSILRYNTATGLWSNVGEVPLGHVTTSIVNWRDRFIIPSGEVRPGKRSPAIWSLQPTK